MAHDFAVFGLDAAKTSGWGLVHKGKRVTSDSGDPMQAVSHGQATIATAIARDVLNWSLMQNVPVVVAAECWDWRGLVKSRMGHACIPLGRRLGAWQHAFFDAGLMRKRWVEVAPRTWRKPLGIPNNNKEAAKTAAMNEVVVRLGYRPKDDNEAEGLCIAIWGEHAPEVREAYLPKRRPKPKAAQQ